MAVVCCVGFNGYRKPRAWREIKFWEIGKLTAATKRGKRVDDLEITQISKSASNPQMLHGHIAVRASLTSRDYDFFKKSSIWRTMVPIEPS